MTPKTFALAAAMLAFAGQAVAQPPVVTNPSFELDDPTLNTNPLGWLEFNLGLTVATDQFRTGVRSAKLSYGTSNFSAITTNYQDASSPTNPYPYDPLIIYRGDPIKISGWYLIPVANALQNGSFTTIKLEFRRTVNNSVYQGFEWPVFGNTNGQWTFFEHTVNAADFGVFPLEPVAGQPARVSLVPLLFGPNGTDPISAVYWDDIQLTQGKPPAVCYPDCDGVGGLTANDFACFLNSYVNGASYANCDGVGGLTANDFACFLNRYVNGCS